MGQNVQGVKVRVKFYASLRENLGVDEKVLRVEGNPSLVSLLDRLEEVMGNKINIIINSEGKLGGNVIVSVNGKLVNPSDLASLKLSDGDDVDIMPLPSGG